MKKRLLINLFLLSVIACVAQDKIITRQMDTIYCRILSVTPAQIMYEQKTGQDRVVGRQISMDQVTEYYRMVKSGKQALPVQSPWIVSYRAGAGYLPWILSSVNIDEREMDVYKRIKTGFQTGLSVHYLLNNSLGIGWQYSFMLSHFKGNYLLEVEPQYPVFSNALLRETHYMNYTGPSIIFQQKLGVGKQWVLSETLSTGLLIYRGESQSAIYLPQSSGYSQTKQNSLIEGLTLGATAGISAGYYFRPNSLFGAGIDFMYGRIKNADMEYRNTGGGHGVVENGELQHPMNLSRFSFSFVYRYFL